MRKSSRASTCRLRPKIFIGPLKNIGAVIFVCFQSFTE